MAVSKQISSEETEQWDLVIGPKDKWYDLRLAELWDYRDLISIFVRRDLVATYKQTVLGPLWFFLSPLFTVIMFTFVFNRIAGISTDGIPAPVFYMGGTTLWNYFSACFGGASNTFVSNAGLFGKVYFPRLAAPIAMVISNLFKFSVQMLMFLVFLFYYRMQEGNTLHFTPYLALFPLLVVLMGGMALGIGIIISSFTTKYRDLTYFIGFGVTLLMYATPVIYPVSAIPNSYRWFVEINPISPLIEMFRLGFTGSGTVTLWGVLYSAVFTLISLLIGAILFHRTEKTFMDTV
jgi:lipopolysaccharide transport system permease protein